MRTLQKKNSRRAAGATGQRTDLVTHANVDDLKPPSTEKAAEADDRTASVPLFEIRK